MIFVLEQLQPTYDHQIQFSKNYEWVLKKYKIYVSSQLNIHFLKMLYLFPPKKLAKGKNQKICLEIYTFLSVLVFYELFMKKVHTNFTNENWQEFSCNYLCSDPIKVKELSLLIFKHNRTSFIWSVEEDLHLKRIVKIHEHNSLDSKIKWNEIAQIFNEEEFCQFRTSHQCKERWDNTLKKKYKKGLWQLNEDLAILDFAFVNGLQWSLMSTYILTNRTEHSIKNRFFSLMSSHFLRPIRTIKTDFNYRNKMLIKEVLDCITFRQMGFETKEDYNRDEEVILLQDYLNEQDSFLEEPNKIA